MAKKKKWGVSPTVSKLHENRNIYANEWEITSKKIFENSYYSWMCSFINKNSKVLEIGTGTGYSTLSLVKSGHSVVSVDQNPECLRLTKERLNKEGIEATIILREKIRDLGGKYKIEYSSINNEYDENKVILIEGDMLNDTHLINWILSCSPFDAIVCWLIGTHNSQKDNIDILEMGIREPAMYRFNVQSKVGQFSRILLNPKGVYHIVDRITGENLKCLKEQETKQFYEQDVSHGLKIKQINTCNYKDMLQDSGKKMVQVFDNYEMKEIDSKYGGNYFFTSILLEQ